MAARRRRRRDKGDKAVGLILGLVGMLLLIAMGAGAWWLRSSKIQLDAENCPTAGPRMVHLIMIDRSDPISGQQAQRIRQYVKKAKDEAAFGTRFDIYTFEGNIQNEFRPVIRVCAPGRPEEANALIENPELIRKQYEERFSGVIDKTLDALIGETTRDNSPIIESLRAAAITSFGAVDPAKAALRVTLVSDMVQHTSAASHFRGASEFSALAKSSIWPALRPSLQGADVRVLYLIRPSATRGGVPIQSRSHQLFWEQLIAASNGRLLSIEPI